MNEEQALEQKKKIFKKNPERFIDMEQIIYCKLKAVDDQGRNVIAHWINPGVHSDVLKVCAFDCPEDIRTYLRMLEVKAIAKRREEEESGLIVPGGDNGKPKNRIIK